MVTTVQEAIAYIHSRQKWTKTPSFERLDALLDALGHPERHSRYVHVAGTNGKGSTSKLLAELLRAHGCTVGLYTSPFIMTFNERIQDDQGVIADDDLVALVNQIAPINAQLDQTLASGPTEFETITAAMFLYFAQHPVDVVVLEVGVGGTWDSTNVITDKLAAVITTIGYDHMQVLGDTLSEIATQKAGIMVPERPTVVGAVPDEALQQIDAISRQVHSPLQVAGQAFRVIDHDATFDFVGQQTFQSLQLNLAGAYQRQNAAVALATLLTIAPPLGLTITQTQVQTAFDHATWPARFETIRTEPLTIIDGAHNEAGIQALRRTLQHQFKGQPLEIIFGAVNDKNFQAMVDDLQEIPGVTVTVVPFLAPGKRTAVTGADLSGPVKQAQNWETAYAANDGRPVVFTGSLYFVSEVRQTLIEKK